MWEYKKFRRMEFMPLFEFLVDMYQPDIYVEIGVQKAKTFNKMSAVVPESHAIDINPMPNVIQKEGVYIHQMSSLECAEEWPLDKKIDLLFIDGNHRFDAVLADFNAWKNFVRPGIGLVLMHDTYPSAKYLVSDGYCSSAWLAAKSIRNNGLYREWEIITLPGPYAGISILRNAKEYFHYMPEPKENF